MKRPSMRLRLLGALALAAVAVVGPATAAGAHPLGNFTVNTYAGLSVERQRVAVDLVVDMAEIPAYQAHRGLDADGDGQVSDREGSEWAARTCRDAAGDSQVTVDGKTSRITVESSSVVFPPGSGGLATLRLSCGLAAPTATDSGEHKIGWRSSAYTNRVGWREVTATGSGTSMVSSDVPVASPSARLTQYPADLLSSPLDKRSASLRVRADGGSLAGATAAAAEGPGSPAKGVAASVLPRGVDAASRSFTALVARRDLTLAFGALALALAVGLGAIHALAPGHGKTVMAAYLVGQRGSLRQAGVIALTVTTTHTIGVLVLGVLLSASTTLASESIYPWLGLTSGAMLAAVGFNLMRRAWKGRRGHDGHAHGHSHSHEHGHSHEPGHSHSHGPDPDSQDGPMSRRTLVAMGVAGGMVPSPSALVVLLGAIALGRAWFGVVLVVGYGVGMALTLTAAGLVLVRARRILDRRAKTSSTRSSRLAGLARAMPAVTAMVIVVVGLFLAAQGATRI
ncbi:MAG: nickel transporter [Actinomycetota bacterium]|nr:nickel transporter [Actinomycetota bacterium]